MSRHISISESDLEYDTKRFKRNKSWKKYRLRKAKKQFKNGAGKRRL